MEGPSLVLQYSVIEEDRLPLVLEWVVQNQLQDTKNLKSVFKVFSLFSYLVSHLMKLIFCVVASWSIITPQPCFSAMGDVEAIDESDAGYLSVVLVDALRSGGIHIRLVRLLLNSKIRVHYI